MFPDFAPISKLRSNLVLAAIGTSTGQEVPMKINDLNHLGVGGAAGSKNVGSVDGRSAQQAANSKGSLRDDHADLSGVAERMLEASSETTPERAQKLDQLRQAFQAGRYHADSALTAKGLVDDTLDGIK
jgi:hypothetical protein